MVEVRRYIQTEMQMSKDVEVVLAEDFDRLEARSRLLESAARKFAGFFSSDDPRHWQLHGLADNTEYEHAKEQPQ